MSSADRTAYFRFVPAFCLTYNTKRWNKTEIKQSRLKQTWNKTFILVVKAALHWIIALYFFQLVISTDNGTVQLKIISVYEIDYVLIPADWHQNSVESLQFLAHF